MRIHPQYGPQFDSSDGTVGKTQLVKRWVIVNEKDRNIFTPLQGIYTRETKSEAEAYAESIRNSNSVEKIGGKIEVCAWWCWPFHFDPVARAE